MKNLKSVISNAKQCCFDRCGLWTLPEIIRTSCTMLLGVFALASGMIGWLKGNVPPIGRGILLVASLLLIAPEFYSDIVGLVMLAGMFFYQIVLPKGRRQKVA